MRRTRLPELALSALGALCAMAVVVAWLARDARPSDAAPAPLGLADAGSAVERAAAAASEHIVSASRLQLPVAERRAFAASDTRSLLELHPERSQLDIVVSAFGAPAAGAIVELFAPSEFLPPLLVPAPGLARTERGGVVTDLDGCASVAVAPKIEWRGVVRWTAPGVAIPLIAELRAVSPIAGYPRTIVIDLGAPSAARFLHVEVRSAPSGMKLGGAELFAIREDGSPALPEFGPTRAVSGADGRALVWWPVGTRLCVDAAGHTPLDLPSEKAGRARAGVMHATLEAATAAAPTVLELSTLGALHGRLDPRWAAGGRVRALGAYVGQLAPRPRRDGEAAEPPEGNVAIVTATGDWRIEGLQTTLTPDTVDAFAVSSRAWLAVVFEAAQSHDAPRVLHATFGGDIFLAPGEDREVPDPFGTSAPVALTARGPGDVQVDSAHVKLELRLLAEREPASHDAARGARFGRPTRVGSPGGVTLFAEGRITGTGRVVAPDLPLGTYVVRTPARVALEVQGHDLDLEPRVDEPDIETLGNVVIVDRHRRMLQPWGSWEHDGRPAEVTLTQEPPDGDD